MADLGLPSRATRAPGGGALTRLAASSRFQAWAARFPLTRRLVRREGEAMFDLVAGFCHSQLLQAFVALELPRHLMEQPRDTASLARRSEVPEARMAVLLNGVAALGLIRRRRGLWRLTTRGAVLAGVPGLAQMIRHHAVLYRDLADPVAFFRDGSETELAGFWPYVFGAGAAADPETARVYSDLMADSQALVAADTLAAVSLAGRRRLLDVGGGSGAFLAAAGQRWPDLVLELFDLPAVMPLARTRLAAAGLTGRAVLHPGSFRDDPLPRGADTISLIRVLYDHSDATVAALLRAVFEALPPGGRLIVSEPMTGGDRPERAGDAYFALYCLAMRTGRARSADEIAALLRAAGFARIETPRPRRPFVASVVVAVRSE